VEPVGTGDPVERLTTLPGGGDARWWLWRCGNPHLRRDVLSELNRGCPRPQHTPSGVRAGGCHPWGDRLLVFVATGSALQLRAQSGPARGLWQSPTSAPDPYQNVGLVSLPRPAVPPCPSDTALEGVMRRGRPEAPRPAASYPKWPGHGHCARHTGAVAQRRNVGEPSRSTPVPWARKARSVEDDDVDLPRACDRSTALVDAYVGI
jgi:hypothetical protein